MAHRLKLARSEYGLGHIYNVSQHVGGLNTCVNTPDDVMLVQFFIKELIPVLKPNRAVRDLPRVTGQMDGVTAFWIYHMQNQGANPSIDGYISPAKGLTYSATKAWLIAQMNYEYKKNFPAKFETLPGNPELSPSLQASLRM